MSSAVNALANVVYVDIVSLIWPNIPNKTGARIVNGLGEFEYEFVLNPRSQNLQKKVAEQRN